MEDLTSVQYAYALENHDPSNYTMVPNIIDYLTYDEIDPKTGEIVVKKLSIYAKELYRVMRSFAGQDNITWKNTDNLAEISNMSKGQVANCKKELQNHFHQLDGNPLIEITEKKKTTRKDGEKINGTIFHQVTIKCIWNYNRAFFLLKKIEKEQEARSCGERADGHVHVVNAPLEGARSYGERNNIHNKTPMFKKQHSTATADSVCSLHPQSSVSVDVKTSAFNWLMQIGCDTQAAINIVSNFTPDEISKASGYVQEKMKKSKIGNVVGYFVNALNGKWWIPKKV